MSFCKYSKYMRYSIDPHKDAAETQTKSQFSEGGIHVREDDKDWGSSGMNNIQADSE